MYKRHHTHHPPPPPLSPPPLAFPKYTDMYIYKHARTTALSHVTSRTTALPLTSPKCSHDGNVSNNSAQHPCLKSHRTCQAGGWWFPRSSDRNEWWRAPAPPPSEWWRAPATPPPPPTPKHKHTISTALLRIHRYVHLHVCASCIGLMTHEYA